MLNTYMKALVLCCVRRRPLVARVSAHCEGKPYAKVMTTAADSAIVVSRLPESRTSEA